MWPAVKSIRLQSTSKHQTQDLRLSPDILASKPHPEMLALARAIGRQLAERDYAEAQERKRKTLKD